MTDLRQRSIDTWRSLSQSTVDDAIDEWRKRLQACVNKKEDILNTWCSNWTWTQTGCADKLDVVDSNESYYHELDLFPKVV